MLGGQCLFVEILGCVVVVIRRFKRAGMIVHLPVPAEYPGLVIHVGAHIDLDPGFLAIGVGTGAVAQYHGVFAFLVFEIVKDAFFLHQAGDKLKVTFTILNAVFTGQIGGTGVVLEVAEVTKLTQHRADDVFGAHLLKDTVMLGLGGKPEAGYQAQGVLAKIPFQFSQ